MCRKMTDSIDRRFTFEITALERLTYKKLFFFCHFQICSFAVVVVTQFIYFCLQNHYPFSDLNPFYYKHKMKKIENPGCKPWMAKNQWVTQCSTKTFWFEMVSVSLFTYHKISKVSPGAYIFKGPFCLYLEGLFSEFYSIVTPSHHKLIVTTSI